MSRFRAVVLVVVGLVAASLLSLGISARTALADSPALSIQDLSVNEGDSGQLQIQVYITTAANNPVPAGTSVDYSLSDGTATQADHDFGPITTGQTTAVCASGGIPCTNIWAYIDVYGDTVHENDETFTVTISNPSSGVTIADTTATVTILNDDPEPTVTVGDVAQVEGDAPPLGLSATTSFVFPVTLSTYSDTNTVVHYSTADGTATTADNDYQAVSDGTLTIPAGQTSGSITILVNTDNTGEAYETFTLNLTSTAPLAKASVTGTIQNDDDLTPPTISEPTITGDTGDNDWYVTDVTVHWTVTDAESPIKTGCPDTVINTDTTGQVVTCAAVSYGGAAIPKSVTIKRDATPPTRVMGTPDRLPDSHGWFNHAVGFTFGGSDATSGIDHCSSTTYSGPDSISGSVGGSCTDKAGNTLETHADIMYDATAPTNVAPLFDRGPDHNGWYNHPVGISFTGQDATSGIQRLGCTEVAYDSPDGANISVNGTCFDQAGNQSAVASATFKYDATGPTGVVGTPARPADSNGWYNQPVTVTFNGSDAVSGIDGCISPTYSGPDSSTASAEGSCTDKAGNKTDGTFALKYDATAPTSITGATSRDPDHNGWFNDAVDITFSGTDPTSGVDSCTSLTYNGPDTRSASVTGTCTDYAGNSANGSFALKYDATAPTNVMGTPERVPDSNGWYNHAVKVIFSGDDATSGIDSCDKPTYSGPDTSTAAITGICTDYAGNETPAVTNLSYDGTAPTIVYTGNQGTYLISETIAISCTATDNLSGLASNGCQNINGPATDFIVGTNTFSATATDRAGNSTSASVSFTVEVTIDSLRDLTTQYASNSRLARQLNAQLSLAQFAERISNSRLKASAITMYTMLVNIQRGRGLTYQEADTLISLARDL